MDRGAHLVIRISNHSRGEDCNLSCSRKIVKHRSIVRGHCRISNQRMSKPTVVKRRAVVTESPGLYKPITRYLEGL